MPVIAAAGITAIGTGTGAVLQSRNVNRATDAQARATREALQYQRERERNQATRYDRAQQEYQRQYADWYSRVYGGGASGDYSDRSKTALTPSLTPDANGVHNVSAPVGAGPGGVAPTTTVPPIAGAPPVTGAPVVPPVTGAPIVPPTPTEPIRTMADLMPSGWSSHQRFMR